MMTREEAKTRICPHREHNAYYGAQNGFIADSYEFKQNAKCRAENCPKWRDGEESIEFPDEFVVQFCKEPCKKYWEVAKHNATGSAIIKLKINHCNQCPKRYGYCGG